MQDTFYLEGQKFLLRTHTSPVQIHVMKANKPPIRMIAPGVVYRRDSDVTHSPMFHQVEGLVVDEKVTFADLKGTGRVFSPPPVRRRPEGPLPPELFPVHGAVGRGRPAMLCLPRKENRRCLPPLQGDRLDRDGRLRDGASGRLRARRLRSEKGAGLRLRRGVERLAMLKFGITDIRLFFENDLRFLRQFG
jgi:phenylalanyl-tRNA synthetase alpha chain